VPPVPAAIVTRMALSKTALEKAVTTRLNADAADAGAQPLVERIGVEPRVP
jgi:hypothetical protein